MTLIPTGSESQPRASVIIPLHRDGAVFRKCLAQTLSMPARTDFEVIVVSDRPVEDLPQEVTFIVTGSSVDTSPAEKRDIAVASSRGEFLAFIDDDAYPHLQWLDRALSSLEEPDVDAVGGPGITPPESGWKEKLGGAIYESILGSGPLRHRFTAIGEPRVSDDLPAYNLVLSRKVLDAVGGWGSTFYGGEDTKLCLELIGANFTLQHHPSVLVFHHRRAVLMPHLRQVGNVGRHRGFFVRRFPLTSKRAYYFLPALLVSSAPLILALSWMSLRRAPRTTAAVWGMLWTAISASTYKRAGVSALLLPGVLVCHHIMYGVNFVRGLLGGELRR